MRWTNMKCLVFEPRARHAATNLGHEPLRWLLLDRERRALDAEVAP